MPNVVTARVRRRESVRIRGRSIMIEGKDSRNDLRKGDV